MKTFFLPTVIIISMLFCTYGIQAQSGQTRLPQAELKRIGVMIGQGKPDKEVQEAWNLLLKSNKDIHVENAVSVITSEARLEAQRNVDAARKRVHSYSLLKEQVSNEIKMARQTIQQTDKTNEPVTIPQKTFSLSPGADGKVIVRQTGSISNRNVINGYIDKLEKQLKSIGDDAQLADIDLQNKLQKQQQIIQMLSNVSKMLSDSALSYIRKIG